MIDSRASPINYALANMRQESAFCLGLHEGRHDVGHFGYATGCGVFTGAGQVSSYRMNAMILR